MSTVLDVAFGGIFAFVLSWIAYGRGAAHEQVRCRQLALDEVGRGANEQACAVAWRIAESINGATQTGSAASGDK